MSRSTVPNLARLSCTTESVGSVIAYQSSQSSEPKPHVPTSPVLACPARIKFEPPMYCGVSGPLFDSDSLTVRNEPRLNALTVTS